MQRSSDENIHFIEGYSNLSIIQMLKISLLIGVFCGITASGVFFFKLEHSAKPTMPLISKIDYIISRFLCGFATSLLGIKFSSDLGIPGCPLLCRLIRHEQKEIRRESKHIFKAGLIYGTLSLFLSLGLSSLFRFFGRRMPAILYMKMVPIVEGLVIGLNAGFFEEAFCRLFLLTFFAKILYDVLFKRKHLKLSLWIANVFSAFIFMHFHHPHSPFELIGSASPLLVISLIVPYVLIGMILGYCYIKHGYESAVMAHFEVDFIVAGFLIPYGLLKYLAQ